MLPNRALGSARRGPRDLGSNLASLRLATSWPVLDLEVAPVDSLAIVLGADPDACPTVRLTVVHRLIRTADGPAPVLDLPGAEIDPGGPVLDANGRLIGLASFGAPTGRRWRSPRPRLANS